MLRTQTAEVRRNIIAHLKNDQEHGAVYRAVRLLRVLEEQDMDSKQEYAVVDV